jgi:uncharacterized membrane protein
MNPLHKAPVGSSAAPLTRLHFVLALGAILLLAVGVRLYGLTATAIWCDEASSIITSQYNIPDLLFHAAHDVHPPLYYLLLHGWMALFGEGLFAIRALSMVIGVAIVGVGILLARQLASPRATLLAGLLLALFPFTVRYSQEVRMYSLLTLVLLGATVALMHWLREPRRNGWLALYVALMTASFYTHYFTIFCVLMHWLHVGLRSLRRDAIFKPLWTRRWWLANVAIALLFMPWVPKLYDLLMHMAQLEAGNDVGWISPVTVWSLPSAMWTFWTLDDGQALPRWLFLLLPAVIVAAALLVARADRSPQRFSRFLLLYTFGPVVLVVLVSLISSVMVERYLAFAAIGLPILLALCIEQLHQRSRLLALGLLAAVLVVDGVGLKEVYRVDEPQFDAQVSYINQHYQRGDTVVISDLYWYFTYVYYNSQPLVPKLFTPPRSEGGMGRPNAYGFGTLVDQQGPDIYVDGLAQLPAHDNRIWLVGASGLDEEFKHIPPSWQLLDDQKHPDSEVRLYMARAH